MAKVAGFQFTINHLDSDPSPAFTPLPLTAFAEAALAVNEERTIQHREDVDRGKGKPEI